MVAGCLWVLGFVNSLVWVVAVACFVLVTCSLLVALCLRCLVFGFRLVGLVWILGYLCWCVFMSIHF